MSRFPHQGILQRQTAPLTQAGSHPLRAITNVLGAPQQNFRFSPDDVRSTETFTLQRLAEGKPDYVGFTITSAMQSANPAILQVMPLVRTNAIEFVHEYFSFPQELAVETPAQAPPGYVEVEKSSRQSSLTSFALGLTSTVQELRTSEGQFIFRGKMITVAIGFIQVAELLAMRALLETPSVYAMYYVQAGQHPIDLARTGRMQDLYFDIMRRRDNGFSELVDLVRASFAQQRIQPTHCIISEGIRSLMMASPMKLEYYRHGPGAANNAERLTDAVGDSFDGIRFVVIRAYELRKKDLRIHPLERNTIIGQHFRLDFFHPKCDLSKYCDKWTSSQVYSMESDMLETIGSDDALEFDGRFSRADGLLHDWHYHLKDNLAREAAASHVPIYQHEYDMFLYTAMDSAGQETVNVASLWGHMEDWALTEETVARVTETFSYAVRRIISAQDLDAIANGLDDIRDLYDKPISADDLEYLRLGERGPSRYNVPQPATAAQVTEDDVAPQNYVPPGYGSVAGYLTLADTAGQRDYAYLDQALVLRAAQFKRAAVKLHKTMVSIYGMTHVALSPLYAPRAFLAAEGPDTAQTESRKNTASFLNFFQNIVDTPKAQLVVGGASVAGTEAALPAYEDGGDSYTAVNSLADADELPAVVQRNLATAERREAFAAQFASSAFGRRYASYSSASSRRTRLSDDADAAGDVAGAQNAFEGFVVREIQPLAANQAAALLAAVVRSVTSESDPGRITADKLRALSTTPVGDATADRLQGDVVGQATVTAFVGSVDAVRGRNGVEILNPVDNNRVLDLDGAEALDADASGTNTNLLRLSIFSQAQAPQPGSRARPQPSMRAAAFGSRIGQTGGALPGFGREAFLDVAGAELVVNKQLSERYTRYGQIGSWLKRVAAQMFILAPISKQTLLAFKKYDIVLPVAWLLEQFNRRYRTSSMIFLRQPSAETVGNVRYMDPDTHMGRNMINKNLAFNVTMYMGATVNDVQNWFVAHDTAVVGYDGGENVRPFDQDPQDANNIDAWNPSNLQQLPLDGPSLLYFMVPAGSLIGKADGKTPLEHDIRGYADAVNYSGASVHRDSQFSMRPYYKSALYYTSKLGLNKLRTPTAEDWNRFHRRENTYNTVTQQGFQKVINEHTNNHDFCIMPQDPFKESVYPGCRELRDSMLPRPYEKTNYKSISIPV
jgi:hypothetical protein